MTSTTRKLGRKADARFADTRVIRGSGNIFVDLGFDAAEASVMALRVQLMMRLRERLQEKGYTQVEAAKRLGVTQPRVSALLKGTWKDFSMDMLLTLAARAGLEPELRLTTKSLSPGYEQTYGPLAAKSVSAIERARNPLRHRGESRDRRKLTQSSRNLIR